MTLGEKQREFTRMIGELISYAYSHGHELTFGDAYRDPRLHGEVGVKMGYGHANSCHKVRLAVDFNVFREGVYLTGPEADAAHGKLHEFWVSIGGAPMIPGDANHYSVAHEGVR